MASQNFLTRPLSVLLLLSLLSTLIYSNTFSVPFVFDDHDNIVENPWIKNLSHLSDFSSSRYVGFLSFALNYHFGRLDVFGYHLVNLLIHITNGFLVYNLVLLLFRCPPLSSSASPRREEPGEGSQLATVPGIALATALLFVAHPIQTQAVTYIVQRLASLAALFYLLAVVCYLKWRLAPLDGRSRYLWYGGALLSTLLAMKTKENSFTLPFMLLLVEAVFFRPLSCKRWISLIPFLLTLPLIPLSDVDALGVGEAGLARQTTEISRSDYLLTQFRVIMTYLRLLILPVNQSLDYDYPISRSLFETPAFFSFLLLFSLLAFSLYLLFNSKVKTHHTQLIAFGLLWFFLTLSIESSIIPITDVIFEHRLYLPSAGLFLSLTIAFSRVISYAAPLASRPFFRTVSLSLILLILSVATYQRNRIWKDDFTLWNDVVSKAPKKARAHNNLGVVYEAQKRLVEAIQEYQTALKLKPDYADAHYNMGKAYGEQERWEEAIVQNREALKLEPNHVKAHNNLGRAYAKQKRWEEATQEFQTALRLDPGLAIAHYNLGKTYAEQGRLEEARRHYQEALQIKPDFEAARKAIESLSK